MKKFYFKVSTDFGDMNLVVKEKTKKRARERLHELYNFNSILEESTEPLKSMNDPFVTLSTISTLGKLHLKLHN